MVRDMNHMKIFFRKFAFLKIVAYELINAFCANLQIYLDLKCKFMHEKWLHELAYLHYKTKLHVTNLNHRRLI